MSRTGRTLQTACSVLQVLRLLAMRPDGVTACQVGDMLGKSTATATYLLNSLCQEGYAERGPEPGHYRLHRITGDSILPAPPSPTREPEPEAVNIGLMYDAVEELYRYTGHRTYLMAVQRNAMVIEEVKGRQGLPAIHGLGPRIAKEAHGLAIGKAVLSALGESALDDYIDAFGLIPYTPNTIIDREALRAELDEVRRKGYAVDEEEYEEGFVCIAAPLFAPDGVLAGAVGLSTSPTRFVQEGPWLIQALSDAVAQVGGCRPDPPEPGVTPSLHTASRPAPGAPAHSLRRVRATSAAPRFC